MYIIYTLIIGLVVGLIAKAFVPGKDPQGIIMTILLGIGGAFVARYLGLWSNWYGSNEPAGFIASIIGAILILVVYKLIHDRSFRTA